MTSAYANMQSTNLSSASPRLAIYKYSQVLVAQNALANSYAATSFSRVSPRQVYYIRTSAASTLGTFGAHGLLVNTGSLPQSSIAPPNTAVPSQPDKGGGTLNDTTAGATTSRSGGGRMPELELDRLSNILKTFNDQFGNIAPPNTPAAMWSGSERW
jgi:hypothetical protein